MKKAIGWGLLILGIIAIIGGLSSTVKSDIAVEIIGYVIKFTMIIGGLWLISKSQPNILQEKDSSISNNLRKASFDITKIEGFSQLPADFQLMNKTEYYTELKNLVKKKSAYDPQFMMIINDFIIPDNISMLKYYINENYFKKEYTEESKKYASPTLKYFADNIGYKASGYPSWFYCIYPDVAKWYISGEGKNIIRNDFREKLRYMRDVPEHKVLEEFLKSEFYDANNSEDVTSKIRPDNLRELIEIFKKKNPSIKLECECD